jgi:hypothetical protein
MGTVGPEENGIDEGKFRIPRPSGEGQLFYDKLPVFLFLSRKEGAGNFLKSRSPVDSQGLMPVQANVAHLLVFQQSS